jgi:small subunit ribosomal protein S18
MEPKRKIQNNDEAPEEKVPGMEKVEYIDYKNTELLLRFLNEQGKILPRRITGITAKQQRQLTRAVKRARHLALIPFVSDTVR